MLVWLLKYLVGFYRRPTVLCDWPATYYSFLNRICQRDWPLWGLWYKLIMGSFTLKKMFINKPTGVKPPSQLR